jgi:tRNA(adenine34) deaminase
MTGKRGPCAYEASPVEETDRAMMQRCIGLSKATRAQGELPFACVICQGDTIIAEATNRVKRDADVIRHAELVAMSAAQQVLGTRRLRNCTLYTNVEPCAMCAFAIRETGIGRVVFSIKSPVMGGYSRWNVLEDEGFRRIAPEYYSKAPQVVAGLMRREAEKVWSDNYPIIWRFIKWRGCFGDG